MIPAPKNVTIKFGDTSRIFFRVRERTWSETQKKWVPGEYRDLTGWTVLAQVRLNKDAETFLLQYTPTLGDQTDPILGRGSVYLVADATATDALRGLTPIPATGVWDCELTTPAGEVFTYAEGNVTFSKDVSRV